LGATYATNNLGVNALTDGAVRCILHRYPQALISLLDYGRQSRTYAYTDGVHSARLPLITMRFSKQPFLRNHVVVLIMAAAVMRLLPWRRLRERWLRHWPVLRHLRSSTMAAAVSGGDSFSDIYGIPRFFYVALPQILALVAGVPLVLLPQTIGPFRSRLCRFTAQRILAGARVVYARDHDGVEYARSLLGPRKDTGKVRFCYDLGFVVPSAEEAFEAVRTLTSLRGSGHLIVGLNVSGLLAMGGYNRHNMFGLRTDYGALVRSVLDRVLQTPNAIVVLIPHVFGKNNRESDEAACRELYGRAVAVHGQRVLLVTEADNQRTAKALIGCCDFFIGSRMHACIAALSQSVPAAGVAYSMKFAGVMRALGLGELVVDARSEDDARTVERIAELLTGRDAIRGRLLETMPTVVSTALGLFDHIHGVVMVGSACSAGPDMPVISRRGGCA